MNRSPLAASLFGDSPYYEARSAGLFPLGGGKVKTNPVTQELIDWADKIFVMSEKEEKHVTHLKERFNLDGKHITDLEVPDTFNISLAEDYNKLKELLKEKLHDYLIEPKGR
ncbi:MAG: hypothetical protein Q7S34_00980 [bacterium]|nr:hypothetical protein [bacterium]